MSCGLHKGFKHHSYSYSMLETRSTALRMYACVHAHSQHTYTFLHTHAHTQTPPVHTDPSSHVCTYTHTFTCVHAMLHTMHTHTHAYTTLHVKYAHTPTPLSRAGHLCWTQVERKTEAWRYDRRRHGGRAWSLGCPEMSLSKRCPHTHTRTCSPLP